MVHLSPVLMAELDRRQQANTPGRSHLGTSRPSTKAVACQSTNRRFPLQEVNVKELTANVVESQRCRDSKFSRWRDMKVWRKGSN
ncbi:hypothetical protein TNCV_2533711 [Trichonephila clavipes]|nr:hypothetical protein TNCV_2533711 [Trichonephila clavipes]